MSRITRRISLAALSLVVTGFVRSQLRPRTANEVRAGLPPTDPKDQTFFGFPGPEGPVLVQDRPSPASNTSPDTYVPISWWDILLRDPIKDHGGPLGPLPLPWWLRRLVLEYQIRQVHRPPQS